LRCSPRQKSSVGTSQSKSGTSVNFRKPWMTDGARHGQRLEEQLLRRNVKRFRGGLVFKAHRRVYHSTLGWRVIKKRRSEHFALRRNDLGEILNTGPRVSLFFTLVTGPRRSLSLTLSDTNVYEPQIRARVSVAGSREPRTICRASRISAPKLTQPQHVSLRIVREHD